ncbi:MAG: T9SS type A sorting domain-containing protein [Bacteroidia bacterium]|nr:T9SS type A sorting domain-containing protein [Bacteroidia bacterium]
MKKINTSKFITGAVAFLGLTIISFPSTTYTGGAPASYTNAPTTGTNREANCTSCHAGVLQTTGTNYNNVDFTGSFTGGGYIPDSTYTLTLSYTHSGKTKFGYQLTCLNSSNTMGGSFATISGNNKSSIITGSVAGATRQYMRQTSSGASGSGAASWSFSWTAPSTNAGDVTIYAVVNSANSASGSSGDIIIAREFTIKPSTLLPVAAASTSNASLCQGGLIILNGSSTNSATSWNWSTPGGSPTSTSTQNATVRYNFPGKYNAILTSTNAKGKSLPDTLVVTVLPAPGPFVAGGATQKFCEGDSILLSSTVQSGASYAWNNGVSGTQLWVTEPGTYFVVATGTNTCSRPSNQISVSYNAKPNTKLTSNSSPYIDSACTNSVLTLAAQSTSLDSFYFYGDGVLLAASDTSTLSTFFTRSTTYGLRVMNNLGCLSDTAYLMMNAKEQSSAPVVTCTSATPSSITFEWTSVSAHLGYEVSTNEGNIWQSPSSGAIGNTHVVSRLQPGDSVVLWIRSIEAAPCSYSAIGVNTCFSQQCVQLNATVQAAGAVCQGDLWTVEVNGLKGENYGLSLDGGGVFTDTIFSFNPKLSRTYTLSVTDSNNLVCPAQEIKIPLTVDRIADINLKADRIGSYCVGDVITHTANDSIDNFDFYVNDALVQSGSANSFVSTQLSNEDSLFVIVSNGQCRDTSSTVYIAIELDPNGGFTYLRLGSKYSFTPNVATYTSYRWDFGDGSVVNTDVAPTYDFKNSAGSTVSVKLEVETQSGCENGNTQTLELPDFAGVQELKALGVSVYPNPTSDRLNIENLSGKAFQYQLYTTEGILIKTATLKAGAGVVDMSTLPIGAYFLRGSINETSKTSIRVIKK